jgi:hypothetical protein
MKMLGKLLEFVICYIASIQYQKLCLFAFMKLKYSIVGANYHHFKENYLPGSIPNKKLGLYGYYMQWCENHQLRSHWQEFRDWPWEEHSQRLGGQGLSRHCIPRCTQTHLRLMQLYAFHRKKFRQFVELENQAPYQIKRVFLAFWFPLVDHHQGL